MKELLVETTLFTMLCEFPGITLFTMSCEFTVHDVMRIVNYQYVIVEKLDRLHGRLGDMLLPYLRELKEHGVWVILTDTGMIRNTFDSFVGNVHTYLDIEVSREESRKLASRMVERGKAKASQGWWLGGTPPFGYARMEVSPDGEDVGILKPGIKSRDDHRVRLVLDTKEKVDAARQAFEMYAQGDSLFQIMKWLHSRGFKTVRGGQWSRTVVQNMLRNPIYRGDLTWGKRRQGVFVRDENLWNDSQTSWRHDKDKWIAHHDERLRIVSDEIWKAVQAKIAEYPREYVIKARPERYPLLDRLVYCETCSSRYYYREEKRGTYLLKRYREYGKNRSVSCKGRVIRADILHDYATELIESAISQEIIHEAFAKARDIIKAESGIDSTLKAGLEPEIKRLEKQERNLVRVLKDASTSQVALTELAAVCEQLDQLRALRNQIQTSEAQQEIESLNLLEKGVHGFRDLWQLGTDKARQRVA